MMVSSNYFRVLGVEPGMGRSFREDEGQAPGRDAVIVLSQNFWKREFAGDPSVLGRTVRLNGVDFIVIGVAPDSFPECTYSTVRTSLCRSQWRGCLRPTAARIFSRIATIAN